MHDNPYFASRRVRLALDALRRDIIFGLVISGILLTLGLWRYLFVIGVDDRLWGSVAGVGAAGLLLTIAFPSAWSLPRAILSALIQRIGAVLFALLLTVVYLLVITPFGSLQRLARGAEPIYEWSGRPTTQMEGWRSKEILFEHSHGRHSMKNLARGFLDVLDFFIRRGHFLILPALLILVSLGLVLFFVKSSALAPLIYTLF